jgi:DNA-binding NtrC family response regulator
VRAFETRAKEIDLVFMDVVLPKLNGPEAYLKMAALKPGVSVIFTTGYATETSLIPIRTREKATIPAQALQVAVSRAEAARKARQEELKQAALEEAK